MGREGAGASEGVASTWPPGRKERNESVAVVKKNRARVTQPNPTQGLRRATAAYSPTLVMTSTIVHDGSIEREVDPEDVQYMRAVQESLASAKPSAAPVAAAAAAPPPPAELVAAAAPKRAAATDDAADPTADQISRDAALAVALSAEHSDAPAELLRAKVVHDGSIEKDL